jgi:hypothetical protein
MTIPEQPAVTRRRRFRIGVVFAIELAIVVGASTLVARGLTPGLCDDDPTSVSSELAAGCEFLADGGYDLMNWLPPVVLAVSAAVAMVRVRLQPLHVGLTLAIALILFALAVSPEGYFWV